MYGDDYNAGHMFFLVGSSYKMEIKSVAIKNSHCYRLSKIQKCDINFPIILLFNDS